MKEKIHIIGSGWGCIGFIENINNDKFEVCVISKGNKFTYTPLLANNLYNNYDLEIDIENINDKLKFNKDEILNLDYKNKEIIGKNKNYKYENLILSHGAEINTFNINGVNENCLFLRTQEDSEILKKKLKSLGKASEIVVIGTNLTGSEVIGNLIDYNKFKISAVDGLKYPLPPFRNEISEYVLKVWKNKNINCLYGDFVTKMNEKNIFFKNKTINYDLAIWCGGLKASILTKKINKNLELDCKFGIPIDNYLNVKGYRNIYALGDCSYSNYPPTAQLAYQQGKYLANNFNNNFKNVNEFKFQNKGQICYIGDNKSVFENKYLASKGYLTYIFNKIVHVYNGINIKQKINIIFGKNDK